MYTEIEIENLRKQAKEAGLSAPDWYWSTNTAALTVICNGCGAESFPEWCRELLTWLYRNYAPAHNIHDCRYEESDNMYSSRLLADDEFRDNCIILWERRYGWSRWINPVALYARNKIRLAYNALRLCGIYAWQEAYQKRKKREVEL